MPDRFWPVTGIEDKGFWLRLSALCLYSLRSSSHLRTETGGECSWAHMRVECRGDRALLARMACAVAFSQWDAGDGILRACARILFFFDLKKALVSKELGRCSL